MTIIPLSLLLLVLVLLYDVYDITALLHSNRIIRKTTSLITPSSSLLVLNGVVSNLQASSYNEDDDDENLSDKDKEILEVFPRDFKVDNPPREYPDYANLKPDDPLFLDMPWPRESGPEASAYARHIQWKRRLSDGERIRWQKWAIYQRMMRKDTFYFSVEDYVFQQMLKGYSKKAVECLQQGKNVEAGLWESIRLRFKTEEELEVKAIVKSFYSAINRKNYDEIRTLWLPDDNVEAILPGYEKVNGHADVEKLYRRMIREAKPFGSIDSNIVSVSAIGYTAVVHTVETVGPGTDLKMAKRKGAPDVTITPKKPRKIFATTVLRKWNNQWRIMMHQAFRIERSPYTGNEVDHAKINIKDRKGSFNRGKIDIKDSNSLPPGLPLELTKLLKEHGSSLSSVSRMKKDGSWEKVVLLDNDFKAPKEGVSTLANIIANAGLGKTRANSVRVEDKNSKNRKDSKKEMDLVDLEKLSEEESAQYQSISKRTVLALRQLSDTGRIDKTTKESLLLDMVNNIARDQTSLVEVAYELLVAEEKEYAVSSGIFSNQMWSDANDLEEFAEQCDIIIETIKNSEGYRYINSNDIKKQKKAKKVTNTDKMDMNKSDITYGINDQQKRKKKIDSEVVVDLESSDSDDFSNE